MGLFDFLLRMFFPKRQGSTDSGQSTHSHVGRDGQRSSRDGYRRSPSTAATATVRRPRKPVKLVPLRFGLRQPGYKNELRRSQGRPPETKDLPYRFAQLGVTTGGYLDLARDGDPARLAARGLPVFSTPEELAAWLELPLGKVAWLTERFTLNRRPESVQAAHYHYIWKRKRRTGWRLIESPKSELQNVQTRILREILDRVPAHKSAHGFVKQRSILTNARPHVGQKVVLNVDLENFYANVSFSRVVAIFRGLGYSREAAIWLGRLTTSALPQTIPFPDNDASAILPFLRRHLPQGAPTSPALANLSAFALDLRLSGLSRCFRANYTRYADDLTFSGGDDLSGSLRTFIPLVKQIIRKERFRHNHQKIKVIRRGGRQVVAGVVVNERPNVTRLEFDRLKATLHNCVRQGPHSQNREAHPDFAAHLRGRIAHVAQLNPHRGQKLMAMFERIRW